MPDRELFMSTIKTLDVRLSDHVIMYDSVDGKYANRAAFILKAYGH